MKKQTKTNWCGGVLLLALGLGLAGCGGSSGGIEITLDYSGAYAARSGASFLAPVNEGVRVTTLTITQEEDGRITAVDNRGVAYSGWLDGLTETSVSFELANDELGIRMKGTLTEDGSTILLDGEWSQNGLVCVMTGQLRGAKTSTPVIPVTPTYAAVTLNGPSAPVENDTATYTAAGGAGTYTWSGSANISGWMSGTTGSSITLTIPAVVANPPMSATLTVRDTAHPTNTTTLTLSIGTPPPPP